MKYLILIYGNTEAWDSMTSERFATIMAAHGALETELKASGEWIDDNELPAEGGKIVRVVDGVPVVTDGPFVELKEIVAGFYMVECASIERAAEIAGRMVEAEFSVIEVRQIGR